MIAKLKEIAVFVLFTGLTSALAQPLSRIERENISVEQTPATLATPDGLLQTFEPAMIAAFKAGNAEKIATWFGDNVDFSITGKDNLYSKSQAEQVLKSFFASHKPSNFTVLHKGKSGTGQYFVCELIADVTYRVTLNTKLSGTATLITSLTIEAS